MTRLGLLSTVILGLIGVTAPATVAAQDAAGVTGAAEATSPDGSATGQFQAVLLGSSLLGTPQNITVEGEVSGGSVAADGSATLSGTATVDMGDGTPALPGVPFTVTVSAGSVGLILNAVALPTATLSAGSITVK